MNIEIPALNKFLNNNCVKKFIYKNINKSQIHLGISYQLVSEKYAGFKLYATKDNDEELKDFNYDLYKKFIEYKPLLAHEQEKSGLSIRTQIDRYGDEPIFYFYNEFKNEIQLPDEPYPESVKGISLKSTGEKCHYFRYKKETHYNVLLKILNQFFMHYTEPSVESIINEIDLIDYSINSNKHSQIALYPYKGLINLHPLAAEDSVKLKEQLDIDVRSCSIHIDEKLQPLSICIYYKNIFKYL